MRYSQLFAISFLITVRVQVILSSITTTCQCNMSSLILETLESCFDPFIHITFFLSRLHEINRTTQGVSVSLEKMPA